MPLVGAFGFFSKTPTCYDTRVRFLEGDKRAIITTAIYILQRK